VGYVPKEPEHKVNIVITGLNISLLLTVVQIYIVGINEEMLPHCLSKGSSALHIS
jgi:mannose/fructose-specific phosphotransferase system component IIA